MPTITKRAGAYVCVSTYAEKEIPKNAGFIWDKVVPHAWATKIDRVAAKLADYADSTCRDTLLQVRDGQVASLAASRATDAQVSIPAPAGLAYLPYQVAGIAYALAHPACLLGDEMGLGKTIQAIGVINADESLRKILVVCPASLRLNWAREIRKWLTRVLSIAIVDGPWPTADIVIINYDILRKHSASIHGREWDMLILDEVHYLKNPKSQRTIEVFGKWDKDPAKTRPPIQARRKNALTGTPIVNRPIELQPIAGYLAPREFGNFWGFAKRYADAHQNGYGWDLTGASHLDELQERLRSTIMVRRLKKDVLTELPSKRRQVIELPQNGAAGAVRAEMAAWEAREARMIRLQAEVALASVADDAAAYAAAVEALAAGSTAAFTEMAKVRHDVAVAKIPYVVEHLQSALEENGKVVVFAHHHDVIDALAAEFGPAAVVLDGRTSMAARDAAVQRFQSDSSCKLFVGGMKAAGVGLTLTAAHHVVFAELDWVPGTISQAEDRCHRIGQHESVLVQHLVLEGSLDAVMASRIIEKQENITAALDAQAPATPEPLPVVAVATVSRQELQASLPPATVAAVHRCLCILAGMDGDRAQQRNDAGYNKYDSQIGNSLAERDSLSPKQAILGQKIVRKYHRQLPTDLYAVAVG